jgi:hypothetical protein
MIRVRSFVAIVGAASAAWCLACSTETKKDVAKSAVHSMSVDQRRESFEATARMLDEDPRIVDELYSVMRQHRPAMHQFLANATRDLREPWLANMTAELLVQNPASVEETLLAATDEISKSPKARAAMDRAIAKRAGKVVDILTDDPGTLGQVLSASLTVVEKKPRARETIVEAASKERGRIIEFVRRDPELAKEMTEALLRDAVKDKPALDTLLRATGAIDDTPTKTPKAKQ